MSDYSPVESNAWIPETAANDTVWRSLVDNDAILYASAGCCHVAAYGLYTMSDEVSYRICYFGLPANFDDLNWRVDFAYQQTGPTASVRVTIADGTSTDSNTTTVTAASGADFVSITPTNTSASTTPRYAYIDVTATAGESITLSYLYVSLVPVAARTGVLASGYISVGTQWYAASSSIPSEIVATLQNNPYRIANDRPQAVYSAVQFPEAADRGLFSTSSSDLTEVLRLVLPTLDQAKTYRVWCYVEQSSTAKADVVIFVGSKLVTLLDDSGIMQTTFTAGAFDLNSTSPASNSVKIRVSSGSGDVGLRTLQILEEPG